MEWTYDVNPDLAQRKAESKAYDMLKAAALSETITHSVTVMSDEGFTVLNKCYHNVHPDAPATGE